MVDITLRIELQLDDKCKKNRKRQNHKSVLLLNSLYFFFLKCRKKPRKTQKLNENSENWLHKVHYYKKPQLLSRVK